MPGVRWPSTLGGRHAREDRTQVLDRAPGAPGADPAAGTRVLPVDPATPPVPVAAPASPAAPPPTAQTPPAPDPAAPTTLLAGRRLRGQDTAEPTPPLLTRVEAAEVGLYVGGVLMALAVLLQAARGWQGTADWVQAVSLGLTSFVLLATGFFVRLPWSRTLGPQRRRAISVLLVSGAGFALIGIGAAADVRRGAAQALLLAHVVIAVLTMVLVCRIARTPASESGVLAASVWGVWVLAPAGAGCWLGLAALGMAWVLLGTRWAQGPHTARVTGTLLALCAAVGLAQGEWKWAVALVLAGLSVTGLVMFVRGGPNHWLALGAASATALAGSITGGQGPLLALAVGGLATMLVSGIALRSATRSTGRPAR